MHSFRKSFIALVGFVALTTASAAPLAPVGAAPEDKQKEPRKFYLTKSLHNGSQALTACAAGYHTASMWEIHDPTSLRYDTELGFTTDDSGSGPPSAFRGWIRTGYISDNTPFAGQGNCNAWTSANVSDIGTAVFLSFRWIDPAAVASPWFPGLNSCDVSQRVWCVQD